jgi:hypothetical protein
MHYKVKDLIDRLSQFDDALDVVIDVDDDLVNAVCVEQEPCEGSTDSVTIFTQFSTRS